MPGSERARQRPEVALQGSPARAPERPGNEADATALHVRAGAESRLLRLRDVRELARYSAPVPLPGAPPEVLGLASVRGEIVTVVSLRRLLGGEAGGPEPAFLAVADARRFAFGIAVDEVGGTVRLTSGEPALARSDLLDVDEIAERVFGTGTAGEIGCAEVGEARPAEAGEARPAEREGKWDEPDERSPTPSEGATR